MRKVNLVSEEKIMKMLVNGISSKKERLLDKIQLLTALKRTEACGNTNSEYLLQNEFPGRLYITFNDVLHQPLC